MYKVDWSEQHCGVIKASYKDLIKHMPDLEELLKSFPEDPLDFTWDVKVHMLMPEQFPCIPNWHFDNVPRVEGKQDFSLVQSDKPMYLWLSGAPLTLFKTEEGIEEVLAQSWKRFTQNDKHKGVMSEEFTWRGFIRATHVDIMKPFTGDTLRRHSQVYLDSNKFMW